MGRLFQPDSPIIRFLSAVADLIALNLLWLICCIPIITIGPACTAMCYVARKIAEKEAPPIMKTFFHALRDNFKQSLIIFLILLGPSILVGVYLLMAASGGLDHIPLIKYLSYLAIAITGVVFSYVYPLLAHFDNTVGNTLKNAFLLPLGNPFLALVVTALNLLPILTLLINYELMMRLSFFWLVIGCSLTAVINAKLLGPFFRQLTPPDSNV